MARKTPQAPLIAIIGATGTGKSQLAVAIATRFNGEVINGDAMQLYAGLPIITNKVSPEEQKGIPHHLLGCIGLKEETWVVGTFVKRALEVIADIRERGKVPVLVGGTHYYTQSLLFRDRLAEVEEDAAEDKDEAESESQEWPILEQPTEVLLEELKKVDPVMADRWHPKDRRKIQRSLEIYLKTGKKASEVYAEQKLRKLAQTGTLAQDGGDATCDEAGLRFPALVYWVHAETDILRSRLDARVDKMLEAGLLDEVSTLNSHAAAESLEGRPVDETRGIWVSIGYKEFKDYVQARETSDVDEKELAKMKAEAVERTKIATRQYAKKQVRWIRIKLMDALHEAEAHDSLYLLDGSDVANFESRVVEPAVQVMESFVGAAPMPDPMGLSPLAAEMLERKRESAASEAWAKQYCEVCGVTCVIEEQWKQHVNSKAHKKLTSKRRQQEREGNDDRARRGRDS